MKIPAIVWLRLARHILPTRKSTWRTYGTEERSAGVPFVITSLLLSTLFFWFALASLGFVANFR